MSGTQEGQFRGCNVQDCREGKHWRQGTSQQAEGLGQETRVGIAGLQGLISLGSLLFVTLLPGMRHFILPFPLLPFDHFFAFCSSIPSSSNLSKYSSNFHSQIMNEHWKISS